MKIEYRVRPVTRFIVTRWQGDDASHCQQASQTVGGDYGNADTAYEVAYALCKAEHDRLGYPSGDERVQYPQNPKLSNTKEVTE